MLFIIGQSVLVKLAIAISRYLDFNLSKLGINLAIISTNSRIAGIPAASCIRVIAEIVLGLYFGKIIHERVLLSVLFLCVQINHTRKELLFLIFKEITLRNHSSLHKTFYSLNLTVR